MKLICKSLLVGLFLLLFFPVQAQDANYEVERIIRFHSDIDIETDGKVTVSESIKVYGGLYDIQRGIVRSIPLYRTTKEGKKERVNFKVTEVQRDGKKEKYKTEDTNGYREIYIGNADVRLQLGIYEYTIVYESYGHVGFFDDFDELYWNVTGNEWFFAIEEASATLHLPEGASPINTACYTGNYGSTASDCSADVTNNQIKFRSNGPLGYKEGLTVAASFTPHIIKRPPPPSWIQLFWLKYKKLILTCLFLTLMLGYYFYTWKKVGVDPEKPVVIPTFNPPHGWSPAVVRYLYKRAADNKAFTVALISMAIKGNIRISFLNKYFTLQTTEKKREMTSEEKKIYSKLFTSTTSQSITVSDKHHTKFSAASKALGKTLSTEWNLKDFFRHNFKYVVWGILLTALFTILYFILTQEGGAALPLLFLLPFIAAGVFLFNVGLTQKGCGSIIFLLMGVGFTLMPSVSTLSLLFSTESFITSVFLVTMFLSLGIYTYLIKAPTPLGAQTKAELEGFRMYLKTAEENRLNLLTPPERTPELFEQYLPYAIALDVENEWGKKFDNVLRAANYSPDWYVDKAPFTSTLLASTLASSLNSSIRSAKIDPTVSSSSDSSGSSGSSSWSSGSSGGGFSGGGGGGGGGRGW